MGITDSKTQARQKRKQRIRKKIKGTSERPRLTVFRSAKHIYAQVVDDMKGHTIASASSLEKGILEGKEISGKKDVALFVGEAIADRLGGKGIKKVVFDRNGYMYHGRVKALSEGARKGGLDF